MLTHHSFLCRRNISGPPQSQRRWNTRAARHYVHQRYKSGRSSPCRRRGTHRAGLQSCHHTLELVRLDETHDTAHKYKTRSTILYVFLACNLKTKTLTPLLTADSVAETGADHLVGSLGLNPALADKV